MPALYDLLGRTAHIDINPSNSVALDEDGSLAEFLGVFSEDLDNEWFLCLGMRKHFLGKILRVHESIRTIKLRKRDNVRCNRLHNLSICTITIPVHRR